MIPSTMINMEFDIDLSYAIINCNTDCHFAGVMISRFIGDLFRISGYSRI